MAQVLASIKCFPEDVIIPPSVIQEEIKKSLPNFAQVYRIDEEPIAFGLVALIAHILVPDSGGDELDKVEEALKGVKGISQVETLLVRRV
jgi:elongation factor 1-beta